MVYRGNVKISDLESREGATKNMHKLAGALVLALGLAFSGAAPGQTSPSPTPLFKLPPPPPHRAPEIDPAGAVAGLTLLAGGLAVLRSRRAKK